MRLEAGLCLYGHELTEETDPVEAALTWSIAEAPPRRGRLSRRGAHPDGARATGRDAAASACGSTAARRPAKAPRSSTPDGRAIGIVTSGGFGPSVGAPIAMGYRRDRASPRRGTELALIVRGKPLAATVVALPFHPHAYYRG